MSNWRDLRNERSLTRLQRALPDCFPVPVLVHAYAQPLIPPLPRLAIEGYWRAHPLRADRLARALAATNGAPRGWRWQLGEHGGNGLPSSFRIPPTPYREPAHDRGPGHCCICGQPVFRFGWHLDLWKAGRSNTRAAWHACCVAAWKLWNAPQTQAKLLGKLQGRRCAATGKRLLRSAEVDHRVPLFQVWREYRDADWASLLGFWGFSNLQALNKPAHISKTAVEAGERAQRRAMVNRTGKQVSPQPTSSRVESPD